TSLCYTLQPRSAIPPLSLLDALPIFSEIFLDDVEVPVSDRVGAEGQGWAVAQSTLASERGLTLVELSHRMRYALTRITGLMRERSEEHTSELQSRENIVCRLLLEKKK